MELEEKKKLADALKATLMTQSEYKHILRNNSDTYKPSYRAMSILIVPEGLTYETLNWPEDKVISKEDAIDVMCFAFKYFEDHLEKERESYEINYDFIYEAWY
jgi:hypothetical protein